MAARQLADANLAVAAVAAAAVRLATDQAATVANANLAAADVATRNLLRSARAGELGCAVTRPVADGDGLTAECDYSGFVAGTGGVAVAAAISARYLR